MMLRGSAELFLRSIFDTKTKSPAWNLYFLVIERMNEDWISPQLIEIPQDVGKVVISGHNIKATGVSMSPVPGVLPNCIWG